MVWHILQIIAFLIKVAFIVFIVICVSKLLRIPRAIGRRIAWFFMLNVTQLQIKIGRKIKEKKGYSRLLENAENRELMQLARAVIPAIVRRYDAVLCGECGFIVPSTDGQSALSTCMMCGADLAYASQYGDKQLEELREICIEERDELMARISKALHHAQVGKFNRLTRNYKRMYQ